jgi:GNAT superfamily N-acetyltransferase
MHGLANELKIAICAGEALAAALPALARLRLTVFRAWPYLYDGTEACEAHYLRTYLNAPGAAVAVAWDGDTAVGASTCLPMAQAEAEVQAPFLAQGLDPAAFFYFGESVLLGGYRGRGVGVRFFELREAQARAYPGTRFAAFCAVQRPADHPRRPADAVGLDAFWAHRGYAKRPGLTCRFSWKDIDEPGETTKTLMFWLKSLHGEALP